MEMANMESLKSKSMQKEGNLKTKSIRCSFCNKSFTRISSLNTHVASVHEKRKNHKCLKCGKMFSKLCNLKDHHNTHDGVRKFKCDQMQCGKSFFKLSTLKSHVASVHEKKKNHKCLKCGKLFYKLSTLRDHEVIHDGVRNFKCDQCSKGFRRKA